jgi:hypothetical protein
MRRQLTLFLPEDARSVVERVRKRLDPVQYALIRAHVTLCRDDELSPWPMIRDRLRSLSAPSITLQFGRPRVLSDGCVLLRATEGCAAYQDLRTSILGPGAKSQGAHITLLHPRNASSAVFVLEDIAAALPSLSVTFHAITLIEQEEVAPWQARRSYALQPELARASR